MTTRRITWTLNQDISRRFVGSVVARPLWPHQGSFFSWRFACSQDPVPLLEWQKSDEDRREMTCVFKDSGDPDHLIALQVSSTQGSGQSNRPKSILFFYRRLGSPDSGYPDSVSIAISYKRAKGWQISWGCAANLRAFWCFSLDKACASSTVEGVKIKRGVEPFWFRKIGWSSYCRHSRKCNAFMFRHGQFMIFMLSVLCTQGAFTIATFF